MRSNRKTVRLPAPRPETSVERDYHDRGERVGYESVWRDGVDITETVAPEKWAWPYDMYWRAGWRPWLSVEEPGSAYMRRTN